MRQDFGYPTLVTPTSQIIGTQAVINMISGQRYRTFTKEAIALLRGEYGALPSEINPEVLQKARITTKSRITCRPADLVEPELPKIREKYKGLARNEEDLLSLALFPEGGENPSPTL